MTLTDRTVAFTGAAMGVSIAAILALLTTDFTTTPRIVAVCAFSLAIAALGIVLFLENSKIQRDKVFIVIVSVLLFVGHLLALFDLSAIIWSMYVPAAVVFSTVILTFTVGIFFVGQPATPDEVSVLRSPDRLD